ncbi:unnamed protein product [Knipowitschia caucasica]|uniref:Uncharacterized protein n=1 Tax=Knipowitschia caucasica TaxID=637954 RepID=A0AAV2MLN6_KNICA
MAERDQMVGDSVDAAMFSAEDKQSSKPSFTVIIQIKEDRGQNSGFTVDSANIMENNNNRKRNIEKIEIKEQDQLDAAPSKQTSSSVRAEPTVQISDDDWKYDQDFPSIGVCMIINNKNFHPLSG